MTPWDAWRQRFKAPAHAIDKHRIDTGRSVLELTDYSLE
jgi:hypothetical protein